jgi:hypothetical protein
MYTGDVGKRLASYRVDRDLLAAVTAKAAERGETVTDVVIQRFQAYIRDDEEPSVPSAPPVVATSVHTGNEWPESYEESPEEPAANNCKHPTDRIDVDTSVCRDCHADVW